jgi:hypothetical protein
VPAAVVNDALVHPERYRGWLERHDPSKPLSPANPLRTCLSIQNISLAYDRQYNPPVWRVGCP